jgi:hypothetical protein
MEILGIGSRVKHKEFGEGVVINTRSTSYDIVFMATGKKEISHIQPLDVIEAEDQPDDIVSLTEVERSLNRILQKWADVTELVPLGQKWTGGMMLLQPSDKTLKPKEIPIDAFFHKIVMIRDRMRTLEQRVNSSGMNDEEKVSIQQYITRCYGSLTSFNVLFKTTDHYFVGDKGQKE